jgi:prepilin-type N-terminal cleavage/methylation domain-containing protein
MQCRFKKNMCNGGQAGFTLVEVVASVVILGIIVSSLLVVLNRYVDMATNQDLKMQAFEVARENMERLLSLKQVTDTSEYGVSEKNPEIQWQTTVETFYEPLTSRMWVRAICEADYLDNQGEEQKVELYHWLTDVSKQQLIQIMEQKQRQAEYERQLAELEGREYDPEDTGLDDTAEPENPDVPESDNPQDSGKKGPGGYTEEELSKMTFDQVWKILQESDK